MHILSTWQGNLIGYFISVVLFYQFYKHAVRHAKEDGAATILLQTIAGISILLLSPFLPFTLPTDWKTYALLVAACVFYALNDRLQTTARKHLEVSVFSIIGQLSTVCLIVFGLTLFHEAFLWSKILGAGFIVMGNMLLLYKRGKFDLNTYVVLSIVATISFATALSIDIGISKQFNLPVYIMITLIMPALFVALAEKISPKAVICEFRGASKSYYLITGIAWGLTIFFSLRAFQLGTVTTVVPLQATSVLLNVLVAYVVLKETDRPLKKIIAALLVITGVYLTVM